MGARYQSTSPPESIDELGEFLSSQSHARVLLKHYYEKLTDDEREVLKTSGAEFLKNNKNKAFKQNLKKHGIEMGVLSGEDVALVFLVFIILWLGLGSSSSSSNSSRRKYFS